jgi:hypothetical protein
MTCREGKGEDKLKDNKEYEEMKKFLLERNDMHIKKAKKTKEEYDAALKFDPNEGKEK